jgi:hypothetical protein
MLPSELNHVDNAWISSHFSNFKEFNNPKIKTGIEHRTNYEFAVIHFKFQGAIHMSNALEVDQSFPFHYRIEGFSYDIFKNDRLKNQVMISENLANELHMEIDDELIVNEAVWTICSIFANEYHNRTIIFPENSGVIETGDRFSQVTIMQFKEAYLSKHTEILRILEGSEFTTLKHREESDGPPKNCRPTKKN